MPLKFFFTGGTESEDGGVESRQSVKERVRQIIDGEDKHHPLSDEEVAEQLNERVRPVHRPAHGHEVPQGARASRRRASAASGRRFS